ncbi:MAG: hypothetical protein IJR80_09045 [Treponema sp.]|nr:hypothetical protein [Treponema sp.]
MIGARVSAASTLVLEKTEEEVLSPRILELRKKIKNSEYIDGAIMRIAQVISNKLMENSEELRIRKE